MDNSRSQYRGETLLVSVPHSNQLSLIKCVPKLIDFLSHLEVFDRNPSCRMCDKTYRNVVVGNIHVRMMLSNFRHVSNSTGKEHGGREARESEATLEHSVVNLPVGEVFQVRLDFLAREFCGFLWHSELLSKSLRVTPQSAGRKILAYIILSEFASLQQVLAHDTFSKIPKTVV